MEEKDKTRFLVGIEIERSQTTEIIVEVEAETMAQARQIAMKKAHKLDRDDIRETVRSLDWDTDGYLTIGAATDSEYNSEYYEPDFPPEDAS